MPKKAKHLVKAAVVGALSALAAAAVVTAAQLAVGSGVEDALWFTRRLVLALGSLFLLVGAAGMAFPSMLSGGEDEAIARTGVHWYALVLASAVGALATGTVLDLVVIGLG